MRCRAARRSRITASGIIIAPSLALHGARVLRRADARLVARADRRDAASRRSSTIRSRRPGMHVASLFCQHVHPDLRDALPGRTWDDARDEVADLMIDTVDRVAPNFSAQRPRPPRAVAARSRARVRARSAATSSTARWRSTSSSRRGRCSATPTTGCRIKGLYLCGSGAHPGGGVTGDPGAQRGARDPQGRERTRRRRERERLEGAVERCGSAAPAAVGAESEGPSASFSRDARANFASAHTARAVSRADIARAASK